MLDKYNIALYKYFCAKTKKRTHQKILGAVSKVKRKTAREGGLRAHKLITTAASSSN